MECYIKAEGFSMQLPADGARKETDYEPVVCCSCSCIDLYSASSLHTTFHRVSCWKSGSEKLVYFRSWIRGKDNRIYITLHNRPRSLGSLVFRAVTCTVTVAFQDNLNVTMFCRRNSFCGYTIQYNSFCMYTIQYKTKTDSFRLLAEGNESGESKSKTVNKSQPLIYFLHFQDWHLEEDHKLRQNYSH